MREQTSFALKRDEKVPFLDLVFRIDERNTFSHHTVLFDGSFNFYLSCKLTQPDEVAHQSKSPFSIENLVILGFACSEKSVDDEISLLKFYILSLGFTSGTSDVCGTRVEVHAHLVHH